MNHIDIDPTQLPDEPFGIFYAWWRGDRLPDIEGPEEMRAEAAPEVEVLAGVSGIAVAELETRQGEGHRLYLARVGGEIVGWGWLATERFEIGELGITAHLPPGNRYLWDFVTLPEWRGQDIYPALIRTMIRDDAEADRFWVGHDAPNVASARGITKAGFKQAGEVYVLGEHTIYVPTGPDDRARQAAAMLGLPMLRT